MAALSGCAFSFPDYPDQWATPVTSSDACGQLTGSYLNLGEYGKRDEYTPSWTPELRAFVFEEGSEVEKPERIELDFSVERRLHVRAVGPSGQLAETWFSEAESTLTCSDEGAEILTYSGVTDTPGNPIVGYEHSSTLLLKAEDGSLVIKSASGGFGLVYLLIPAGASGHYWYRFPASE